MAAGNLPTVVGILGYLGLTVLIDFSSAGHVRRVKCQ